MGMVLIPISRHSALASFFKLSVSTTLAFHMITAYSLFILVLIHGFLYVSWIPVFNALSDRLRMVFPVLNPTYLYHETWPGYSASLGIWRSSLIFTGIVTTVIFCLIFVTTLPPVRSKHFNIFYFTHLLTIVAVVIICLHASTMFYCTSPGLAMWLLDWGMRLYELRQSLYGNITTFGNGWYCLSLPLPRRRLDGCACTSPLAHFYIHHSDTSIRELHPFTTITHLASQNAITPKNEDDFNIQFLFRKRGRSTDPVPARKDGFLTAFGLFSKKQQPTAQWTNRLAGLVDELETSSDSAVVSGFGPRQQSEAASWSKPSSLATLKQDHPHPVVDVPLRLEGPYFTPVDPARYNTVICFVAGTGVSGAIAIAGAFTELERERAAELKNSNEIGVGNVPGSFVGSPLRAWERCVVIWSVRAEDYVDLPFLKVNPASNLEVRIHLTGGDRPRLDIEQTLGSICGESTKSSVWVYLSGPNRFIEAGEKACKAAPGVDWYGARWDI
ncbi:MAG: hypothetical protein M1830_008241 [Pleopsidium flavum]|nr:MAG: hypothetical protein M1830_008241 [Pleopsidium flavum]